MSAPRAPEIDGGRETILAAVAFLREEANAPGLNEVADMLEDIADGKWSLTNATPTKPCQRDPAERCHSPIYCTERGCQL